MKQGIITIGREFGNGWRTIGKLVARKLGISCCDAELITEMAKNGPCVIVGCCADCILKGVPNVLRFLSMQTWISGPNAL